jgi:hypothetical protein
MQLQGGRHHVLTYREQHPHARVLASWQVAAQLPVAGPQVQVLVPRIDTVLIAARILNILAQEQTGQKCEDLLADLLSLGVKAA